MKLQEAIKSGKKFKRPLDGRWHQNADYQFSKEEILADDWILEEEMVHVTRDRLLDALTTPLLFMTNDVHSKEGHLLGESIGIILDRLGFQKKI